MRPGITYLAGALAGLALASLGMLALIPSQHTSESILQIHQVRNPSLEPMLHSIKSRAALANLILSHNLYAERRQIEPMEDTVEHMRERIRASQNEDRITLAFTHHDPAVAQRITSALTASFLDEFNREQRNQNAIWTQTWTDASDAAANAWTQAAENARTNASPRATYDVELARQHYAAMKEKLAASNVDAMLLKRQLGPRLEILDLGSLPSSHATLWPLPLIGLLLGLFVTALARGYQ